MAQILQTLQMYFVKLQFAGKTFKLFQIMSRQVERNFGIDLIIMIMVMMSLVIPLLMMSTNFLTFSIGIIHSIIEGKMF